MDTAYNIVRNQKTDEIYYKTYLGLTDACDWMMSRIPFLDLYEVCAEEIQPDGECTGTWTIEDLLEENPAGWTLADGTTILGAKDKDTGTWYITSDRMYPDGR